jgi:hypothetical protein
MNTQTSMEPWVDEDDNTIQVNSERWVLEFHSRWDELSSQYERMYYESPESDHQAPVRSRYSFFNFSWFTKANQINPDTLRRRDTRCDCSDL